MVIETAHPEHPGVVYHKTWDIEGSLARPPG